MPSSHFVVKPLLFYSESFKTFPFYVYLNVFCWFIVWFWDSLHPMLAWNSQSFCIQLHLCHRLRARGFLLSPYVHVVSSSYSQYAAQSFHFSFNVQHFLACSLDELLRFPPNTTLTMHPTWWIFFTDVQNHFITWNILLHNEIGTFRYFVQWSLYFQKYKLGFKVITKRFAKW